MKNILLIIALFSVSFVLCQNNLSLAESYFREGEYEKATQLYESLEKNNPYNTRYLKRLITCYQETNNYEKASELLQKKLLNNPSQHYLRIEVGYNFDQQKKPILAKKEYDFAIKAIESNPSLGGIMGRMFQQNNLLDYALKAYSKALDFNKDASFEYQIAQIYGEKGAYQKMFDSCMELLDKDENYLGGIQRYISRYISDDANDTINISLKKSILKKSISNPKNIWNELLSWLFTKQKQYGRAFIQEKGLFNRGLENVETIFRLGKIAFNNQDYEIARNCYLFLLDHTNFIEENLVLFEEKLKEYGVNRNTLEIQLEFADYLTFKNNTPQKAIRVLEKALSFSSSKFKKARIKLKLGEVLVFVGKFNEALIYFSQVQTKLKNHPLSQEARFKVAQTSYFKILKNATTQLTANDAVDLFLLISDNESKDSIPSGLEDFAKAELLAYQNKNTAAITLYSNILKKHQGQSIEDEALFNQAKLFVAEQQYELAVTNLLKIISIDPEGILTDNSYYLLGEIYKNNIKDFEKASEYYQKIIFEKPSSIYLVGARQKYRELRGDNIE